MSRSSGSRNHQMFIRACRLGDVATINAFFTNSHYMIIAQESFLDAAETFAKPELNIFLGGFLSHPQAFSIVNSIVYESQAQKLEYLNTCLNFMIHKVDREYDETEEAFVSEFYALMASQKVESTDGSTRPPTALEFMQKSRKLREGYWAYKEAQITAEAERQRQERLRIEAERRAREIAEREERERIEAERKAAEAERLRQEQIRKEAEERAAEAERQRQERLRIEAARRRQEELRVQRELEERQRQIQLQREREEAERREAEALAEELLARRRQEEERARIERARTAATREVPGTSIVPIHTGPYAGWRLEYVERMLRIKQGVERGAINTIDLGKYIPIGGRDDEYDEPPRGRY